jgi:hypothetical protein
LFAANRAQNRATDKGASAAIGFGRACEGPPGQIMTAFLFFAGGAVAGFLGGVALTVIALAYVYARLPDGTEDASGM